ncbi:MAG: arylesterase [Desulfovibrionales bacterium]
MKHLLILSAGMMILIAGFLSLKPDRPEITNPTPSDGPIVCFGDSLTSGTGASPGMDYPSQLSLLSGSDVINAGIPGDTTQDGLERLQEDVLSHSPGIVLITLGGNDLKNGVDKATAFGNLRTIIESIQQKGALVVVGGIDVPLFARGFGGEYRKVVEETGAVLVPNVYEGIMGDPDLMSDRIHPNDAGYGKMAALFFEAVRPYLE